MAKQALMSRRTFAILGATAALAATAGLSGCGAAKAGPMFDVKVTRTWKTGSYFGTEMLVLDLDVRNNGEQSMPANMVGFTFATATQAGAALAKGVLTSEVPGAVMLETGSLAPGAEGKSQAVFELQGSEPVEVVIAPESVDGKSTVEVYRETIDLDQVEKVESEPTFEIEVGRAYVTDDGKGKDLVVVELTFTNNAEQAQSLSSAADMQLFQNDVELKSGYLPYQHPSYDEARQSNWSTSVKKGASVEVQASWELLDAAAPVELRAVDTGSYDQRAVLEKTIDVSGGGAAAGSGVRA